MMPMVSLVAEVIRQEQLMVYARLYWLSKRKSRRVTGVFHFPFGPVRYVDARSLIDQYCEIFINRQYEVIGLGNAPRIIDCGGNIGLSVLWFKQRYPDSHVIVYEADPLIVPMLIKNIHEYDLDSVDVVQAAVGTGSEPVTFLSDGIDGGRVGQGEGIRVDSVRLSDQIEGPIDILKVDIEGSEFALFKDLCRTGKIAHVKHIVCEIHGRSDSQDDITGLCMDLTRNGFRLTVSWAQTVASIPGPADPTPFPAVGSGKFLMYLYAWR